MPSPDSQSPHPASGRALDGCERLVAAGEARVQVDRLPRLSLRGSVIIKESSQVDPEDGVCVGEVGLI